MWFASLIMANSVSLLNYKAITLYLLGMHRVLAKRNFQNLIFWNTPVHILFFFIKYIMIIGTLEKN